jgi:hypothetical protein
MKGRSTPGIVVLALVLLTASSALAHPRGGVLANGGNRCFGGGKILTGTVGQTAVGVSGSATRIVCSGFWCFGGSRVVAVDDGGGPGGDTGRALPKELSFSPPAPNPTHGDSRFTLALPRAARVSLTVYDVSGRQLGETVTQEMDAGWHQLSWRASDGHSGVFFARLTVDGAVQAERRIVLVR